MPTRHTFHIPFPALLGHISTLLLAVVSIGVAAATVGVVHGAERRVVQLQQRMSFHTILTYRLDRQFQTYSAPEVITAALAVELAGTVVDVGGAVAVDPLLRDKTSGASIAGVESNRLEDGEHFVITICRTGYYQAELYFRIASIFGSCIYGV